VQYLSKVGFVCERIQVQGESAFMPACA